MKRAIIVSNSFDGTWPWVADHFRGLWERMGPVQFTRLSYGDECPLEGVLQNPAAVQCLAAFGIPVTKASLEAMPNLRELAPVRALEEPLRAWAEERGILVHFHPSEAFWAESVSECALGLTICGLRRIPQLHGQIRHDLAPWHYHPAPGEARPGGRGVQYGDDDRFTSGTVAGKRVRIVGMGNIAARYARAMSVLGADVTAYDPYAQEPAFALSGARRELRLERLVEDAEIFAPMVPLREGTHNLVHRELVDHLPKGCLVVLVTRAGICDMKAIRRRVLNDELSLAADVFDLEPLPLDDPLLGRHNVVHTPHLAGRTLHANQRYAEILAGLFHAGAD